MNRTTALVVTVASLASLAQADTVQVKVTIENLAAANGVALSPITLAAHDGTFDAFDVGAMASLGTRRVAESGSSATYLSEAVSAFPGVVTGVATASVNAFGPGIFLPGGSGSIVLTLDTTTNRFLSYGAMVVPSNDAFIGNDNPAAVQLFDAGGNFVAQSFTLKGSQIWDAGTEVNQPFGAAFLAGSDGADHVDQNGVVTLGADFGAYSGLLTAAGYDFTGLPGADSSIARFSFEVVPTPGSVAVLGMSGLMAGRRRRGMR